MLYSLKSLIKILKKTEIANISRFNIIWIDDKTSIGYKFIDQYDVNEV